jgi:hypothetical protein
MRAFQVLLSAKPKRKNRGASPPATPQPALTSGALRYSHENPHGSLFCPRMEHNFPAPSEPGPRAEDNPFRNLIWRKLCPVCHQPMTKEHPTDTVACPCGKYIWKG